MAKAIYIISLLSFIAILSAETYSNNNTISCSVNPLYLHYSQFTDSSANSEIGGYLSLEFKDKVATGVTYRSYPFNAGDHFFWGTKLGYFYEHSDTFDSLESRHIYRDNNFIQTGLEIGWRWNWSWGLMLETGILSDLDIKLHGEFQLRNTVFLPTIGIGYIF